MDDNSCTCSAHHKQTLQLNNGFTGLNVTISMQSVNSANLRIECDPNINGSSSKNPVNTLDHIRNNFKRNLQDEAENVENNPPKKAKLIPEKKLYVQENPEISNIIRKYQN